jgi:hypothetical protein
MGMENLEAGEYWNYRGFEEGDETRKAYAETVPLHKQWIRRAQAMFLLVSLHARSNKTQHH